MFKNSCGTFAEDRGLVGAGIVSSCIYVFIVQEKKVSCKKIKKEITIGDCRLILGDCLEIMPTLGKVDAVITDPPYAIPTTIAQGREKYRSLGDLSIVETAMNLYLGAAFNLLSDEGRAFVFCDGNSYHTSFRVMYPNFNNTALLVWDKTKFGMGREFRKQHELILHGWHKNTPIYKDGIGRPDILKAKPVSKRLHPAQKPVGLIEQLLIVCQKTILDPFMGSGTTGVACVKTGRKFIGIEIDENFYNIAVKRITNAYKQHDMLGYP